MALRIATGRDGTGRYVLGNGFAFGAEIAPAPGGVGGVESCFGGADCVGAVAGGAEAEGAEAARLVAQPRAEAIATSIT